MKRYLSFARTLVRANRRQRDLPRLLTYIVTFTCNARCVMCDSWRKPSNDLSLEEIERIFAGMPRLDAVRLSGGEPFVRKDLPQIVELVRKQLRPLMLHITSNGFLTDRIVELCEQRDHSLPLSLLISIDGVAEKHDQIRGIGHAWDRAMATVRALAPRQKELRMTLAVNQTLVDRDGIEHYRKLRDLLAPLGVRNQLVVAYDDSATYNVAKKHCVAPRYPGEFRTFGQFEKHELAELLDEVDRDVSDYPWPERMAKRYYLTGIRQRLLERSASPNPACVALSAHMRMLPDGTVPTCQFNTAAAGNLRDDSFQAVWYGAGAEQQRAWVNACPGCWAECEVLPNAIYTGDIAREALRRKARALPIWHERR